MSMSPELAELTGEARLLRRNFAKTGLQWPKDINEWTVCPTWQSQQLQDGYLTARSAEAHKGTYLRSMHTWLGNLLQAKLLVNDMAEGIGGAVWW